MATNGFNLIYGSIWSLHIANYTVSFRTTVGTALVGASERCKSWRSESNGGNYPALWSDYTMEAWNGRVSISIDLLDTGFRPSIKKRGRGLLHDFDGNNGSPTSPPNSRQEHHDDSGRFLLLTRDRGTSDSHIKYGDFAFSLSSQGW